MDISRLASSLDAFLATQVDTAGVDTETPVATRASTTEATAPAEVHFTSNVVSITSRASSPVNSTQASGSAWTPEARQQKMADLKAAILNGSYNVPSGAVAQALMNRMKEVALNRDPL